MSEQKHTPGLLKISHGCMPGDNGWSIRSNNAAAIRVKIVAECWPATIVDDPHRDELFANARRLAAAWNACDGIPTEALEAGVVRELLEALRFIVNDAEPGEDAKLTVNGYNRACAAIAKAEGA